MDYANPALISARRLGQQLGILRPAQRLYRRLFRVDYEADFDRAMLAGIRPGDTVWDIGANVGHYTAKFAEAVGPSGKVVAFEPSPTIFDQLSEAMRGRANVVAHQVALSDADGAVRFDTSAHHHTGRLSANGDVSVSARRGDDFLTSCGQPDVIKIDVEGFEPEVLEGMPAAIAGARGVYVEVHFLNLQQRGIADGPAVVQRLLRASGLRTAWIDPSHICGTRA